jgi:hypothetical protein
MGEFVRAHSKKVGTEFFSLTNHIAKICFSREQIRPVENGL